MPLVRQVRSTVLLLCLAGLLSAQTVPQPLSPEAQEALNKGVIAAKVPDYLLAIRYFEEARKLAPDAPEIYFNLGLAESKIPGRELRAIAWFGAYLAASPYAANAAAVKEQIAVLDVKNRSNVSRLIRSVQSAASQLRDDPRVRDGWGAQIYAMSRLVDLCLASGDIAGAQITADAMRSGHFKSKSHSYLAEAKAKAGDIAGANKSLATALKIINEMIDLRTSDFYRDKSDALNITADAQVALAKAQIKYGDIAGAQKTFAAALETGELTKATYNKSGIGFEHTTGASDSYSRACSIARAQVETGNIAGALNTAERIGDLIFKEYALASIAEAQATAGDIGAALTTNGLFQDPDRKLENLIRIAKAQAKNGDNTGAKKTLAPVIEAGGPAKNPARWLREIAPIQAMSGDIAGARQTADLIQDPYDRSVALLFIAATQTKSGDIVGARQTAEHIGDPGIKSYTQRVIARAQATSGDIESALQTADLIQDPYDRSGALLDIADAQTKHGDNAGAQKTLASAISVADLAESSARCLHNIAQAQAKLGDLAGARKTAEREFLVLAKPRISDWLKRLDGLDYKGLNTGIFLDLASHLKSLPQSEKPEKLFEGLLDAAQELVKTQNSVSDSLKVELRGPAP
jgi:tetratricopeptide (TPR) repeat protein